MRAVLEVVFAAWVVAAGLEGVAYTDMKTAGS